MTGGVEDGGPAFPSVLYKQEPAENTAYDGMSLRDWFAGQALAGLIAHEGLGAQSHCESLATGAFAVADAMLRARVGASS